MTETPNQPDPNDKTAAGIGAIKGVGGFAASQQEKTRAMMDEFGKTVDKIADEQTAQAIKDSRNAK